MTKPGRGPTEIELRVVDAIKALPPGATDLEIVRAMIRVLQEPTPSMIEAGCRILSRRGDIMADADASLGRHAIAVCKMRLRWRAMIEAASPATKMRKP